MKQRFLLLVASLVALPALAAGPVGFNAPAPAQGFTSPPTVSQLLRTYSQVHLTMQLSRCEAASLNTFAEMTMSSQMKKAPRFVLNLMTTKIGRW